MEVRKEDQRDQDEKVVEIEIERLRDFKNHPFKVQADSQMKELQEEHFIIRKTSIRICMDRQEQNRITASVYQVV